MNYVDEIMKEMKSRKQYEEYKDHFCKVVDVDGFTRKNLEDEIESLIRSCEDNMFKIAIYRESLIDNHIGDV